MRLADLLVDPDQHVENLLRVEEGGEQLPSQVEDEQMNEACWEHMGVVAIEVLGRSDQLTVIISFPVAPRQSIILW